MHSSQPLGRVASRVPVNDLDKVESEGKALTFDQALKMALQPVVKTGWKEDH